MRKLHCITESRVSDESNVRQHKVFEAFEKMREEVDEEILNSLNPNAANKEGLTPLMWIIDCEYPADIISRYLEKKNINLNQQDSSGYTALHYAYMMQNDEIVQLLYKKGA